MIPTMGREFGYVIKGQIQLHFGSEVVKARAGESFIFRPKRVITFLTRVKGQR